LRLSPGDRRESLERSVSRRNHAYCGTLWLIGVKLKQGDCQLDTPNPLISGDLAVLSKRAQGIYCFRGTDLLDLVG
jgi:hypothetical protein